MIFLGRERNLLHAAADWLLDSRHVPEAPDLSALTVVVRGGRASRRLLELLALRAQAAGTILAPPAIVTPAALVLRVTEAAPDEGDAATPLASALAWAQVLQRAPARDRERLFRLPPGGEAQTGLRPLLGMARHLAGLWSEVGGAGLSFQDVAQTVAERFPEIADFEAPRWKVLEALHRRAVKLLRQMKLEDHTDRLRRRAREGAVAAPTRVVLAGVVEMPGVVRDFLARLPLPPVVLVAAEEREREGFDAWGALRADFWNACAAELTPGQLHLVERDRDQAARAATIIAGWREGGLAAGQITLAAPKSESLPRLREALETRGLRTRGAQGRPVSQAPAFQLLQRVAAYLDRTPDEPPAWEAVAALMRHPDMPGFDAATWRELDAFGARHLPARFDPAGVRPECPVAHRLQEKLAREIDLGPEETTAARIAAWTRAFLLRVYGGREESALSPAGRVAVEAMTRLRDGLDATEGGRVAWPGRVRPAEFLHALLQFLGMEGVPEPPDRQAVELVGWLELLEDDAPALVVASFHEGAVPESVQGDPFLPGALREALGLGDNASRLARDAFALAGLLAMRGAARGRVALIAPRFDAEENPVRPSRLLLNGLRGGELAQRVWHLTGPREAEPAPELAAGPGFGPAPVDSHSRVTALSVTAFRRYLESPRAFFFQNALRLRAEGEMPLELEAGDIGGVIHQVLALFGVEAMRRHFAGARAIEEFLLTTLNELMRERFGPWAQPAVEVQTEGIARRLRGFAAAQARLGREGWTIRYVEGEGEPLSFDLAAADEAGVLTVTGKIDRIDGDASGTQWRIIDYKTSAEARDPLAAHVGRTGWRDLQLPLYLKLAAPFALQRWGVGLTPENCALVYFQLPEIETQAGLSKPFPEERIAEGWVIAARVAARILRGEFADNPALDAARTDPALLALCGQAGLGVEDVAPAEED